MVIDNKYEIGQIVYLKTDPYQYARQIYSFEVYKGGEILYRCICGTAVSAHYVFELTVERDVLKTVS